MRRGGRGRLENLAVGPAVASAGQTGPNSGRMLKTTALRTGSIAVLDYRCTLDRQAPPYPELHDRCSVSYVRAGTFGYRVEGRMYELVAGSVVVGRAGDEYV